MSDPDVPAVESGEAPGRVRACSAVTKLRLRERDKIKERFPTATLYELRHPDQLCELPAGHPGPHAIDVADHYPDGVVWLRWEDGDRPSNAMDDGDHLKEPVLELRPLCPAEIPPPEGETDEVFCLWFENHWGAHSFETDHDDRSWQWWDTHEPYREERETLHAMLSSGSTPLGPGPGYWEQGGFWLSGHRPRPPRAS
jgi:hypothetical protein